MRSVLLLSLLACVACAGPNKKNRVQENLNQAYQLIDAQRTEEAITFLETLLESDSQNREYRLALASAYAHLAGFKIQKLAPMVTSVNQLKDSLKPEDTKTQVADKNLVTIIRVSAQLSKLVTVFSQIPQIEPKKMYLLRQAIKEVDKISQKSQAENMYQAILRVVMIRSILSNDLFVLDPSVNKCQIRFDVASQTFTKLGREFAALFDNVIAAQPQNGKELSDWKIKLVSLTSDASLLFASIGTFDEGAKMLINSAVIEEGLVNLTQCKVQKI